MTIEHGKIPVTMEGVYVKTQFPSNDGTYFIPQVSKPNYIPKLNKMGYLVENDLLRQKSTTYVKNRKNM